MLDDGSLTSLPDVVNTVPFCHEDPVAEVCSCGHQNVPAFSGDVVIGDGVYTRDTSLTLARLDVAPGCILQNAPRSTLLSFDPGTPHLLILRATDHIAF